MRYVTNMEVNTHCHKYFQLLYFMEATFDILRERVLREES